MDDEATREDEGKDAGNWPFPYDPVVEAYKKNIDRTLLRENLKRTVEERFERLEELQRFAEELRRAGREARGKP